MLDMAASFRVRNYEENQTNNANPLKCFKSSEAFNRAFDSFASALAIVDDSDKEQCEKVREELGFEADHPFDIEVAEKFTEYMCDVFFSGVDHMTEFSIEPPQFEKVEYEDVEFEELYYEAPDYDEDPVLMHKELDDLPSRTDVKDGDGTYKDVNDLQRTWLNAQHALVASEHLTEYISFTTPNVCEAIPATLPGGIPFVPFIICKIISLVLQLVMNNLLLIASITHQVLDDQYEMATLGPNEAVYGNHYSKGTYHDMNALDKWNFNALTKINSNINEQHTSMRKHLQDRHLAMETNIGQDIVDTQNILGQKITDAQNAVGKGIIDTSNGITEQHNKILSWIDRKFTQRICQVHQATGGECLTFIGPLVEGELHAPIEVSWPENQLSLTERFKKLDSLHKEIKEEVRDGIEGIQTKMSGYEQKAKAVEGKTEVVQEKIEEIKSRVNDMKDMMAQLFRMIQ